MGAAERLVKDAYLTQSCEDFTHQQPPEACRPVAYGTKQVGDSCVLGSVCASGYCGSGDGVSGRSRFSPSCNLCEETSGLGEVCRGSGSRVCQPFLYCTARAGEVGTCEPLREEGERCGADFGPCRLTLNCDDWVDGVCYKSLENGEPCQGNEHPWCLGKCDRDTGMCRDVPRLALGDPCGTMCDDDGDCQTLGACARNAECRQIGDPFSQMVCTAMLTEGQKCGHDGWSDGQLGPFVAPTSCLAPAICWEGTCQVVDPCCP